MLGIGTSPEEPMPVTAKLSRKFYEALGDDVANELVEWFNAVDATYRSDLRDLNELNFARFDAKLEQRTVELDAKIDRLFRALDAKIDTVKAELEAKIVMVRSALEAKIETVKSEFEAKIETVKSELEAKIETVTSELEAHLERRLNEFQSALTWRLVAMWATTLLAIGGLYFTSFTR